MRTLGTSFSLIWQGGWGMAFRPVADRLENPADEIYWAKDQEELFTVNAAVAALIEHRKFLKCLNLIVTEHPI